MIVNIPTEGLYDKSNTKIIEEMLLLRTKILKHGFEINRLGTGNLCYSIVDSIITPFNQNKKIGRKAKFWLNRFRRDKVKQGKILTSYNGVVWTKDQITSSTLPYPVRRTEYPWAILNSDLEKSMNILDIGSGVSLFPMYLSSKGYQVISLDNDKILMNRLSPQLAKWTNTKVDYRLGDITKIPFDDNTFDRVFCISVIEHLEEERINDKFINYHKRNLDVKAIGEMLRVLKPNGLLILTFDWNEDPDEHRSYTLDDIYERVLKPYQNLLISDKKPNINWEELKQKHVEGWKSFPPHTYVFDGWAIGVILKK